MKIASADTFAKVAANPVAGPIVTKIVDVIIVPIVEVMFLIATLVFIYGIFQMIAKADDANARKDAQNSVLWGVIGMVIMVSVYGIIRVISNTLGVGDPFL